MNAHDDMIRAPSELGEGPVARTDIQYPKGLKAALGLALAYRVMLTLLVGWWTMVVPTADVSVAEHYFHGIERQDGILGQLFVKYDSYWYLNIARFGYQVQAEGDSNLAFLPAYPTLIDLLGRVGVPGTFSGVLLSHFFLVAALVFAYRYATSIEDTRIAVGLLCFLAVFPSSWVWQMVYTEAMFCAVLFALLDCYQRRHYGWAAMLCLAIPFIRGIGLAAVAAVIIDSLVTLLSRRSDSRDNKDLLCRMAVAGAGLSGVTLLGWFYHSVSGHFFGFLRASSGWSTMAGTEGMTFPLFGTLLQNLGDPEGRLYLSFLVLYVVAALGAILLRRDLGSWFCLGALIMICGGSYTSLLRYLLPLLPAHLFLVMGLMKKGWFWYVLPILAVLQTIVTRLYLDWQLVV